MGDTLIVTALAVGAVVSVVLLFVAAWPELARRLEALAVHFRHDVDIAGLRVRPEGIGYGIAAVAVGLWLAVILLFKPNLVQSVFDLGACVGFALVLAAAGLRFLAERTVRAFADQLETILRSLAGAVRVGLGLRQAIIHVAEETPPPAGRELSRVIGLTNLGMEMTEALDELARRMPIAEVQMMARVLRVQTRTGSDLAGVLEGLADTIRDRRRFKRKLNAMTSQGRASAIVLGLIPLVVGALMFATQPQLRDASLTTALGRVTLMLALGLDALAAVILLKMVRIDA